MGKLRPLYTFHRNQWLCADLQIHGEIWGVVWVFLVAGEYIRHGSSLDKRFMNKTHSILSLRDLKVIAFSERESFSNLVLAMLGRPGFDKEAWLRILKQKRHG